MWLGLRGDALEVGAVGIWRHEDVWQVPFKQSGGGHDRDRVGYLTGSEQNVDVVEVVVAAAVV